MTQNPSQPIQENDNAGVKIVAPVIYVGFFLVGIIFESIFPIPAFLPNLVAGLVGWLLAVTSLVLVLWGLKSFYIASNPVMPHKPALSLMTTGAFGITRNPLYLSLLLLYLGTSIFTNSWWPIIFIPILIFTINHLVIVKEEAFLTRKFDEEYLQYCRRVRRWI
jgi:protein-S-isoprenylcysteine O-methyltransferase Ste14